MTLSISLIFLRVSWIEFSSSCYIMVEVERILAAVVTKALVRCLLKLVYIRGVGGVGFLRQDARFK